ncbi:RBBP9/YdeN family alpha/beta hydrolase [Actinoplanes aureus]|uniref:Alpha/beta hydrolase n=1 Tax=Actinoplanes aureus TaxID=2792083 RepID=A0A931CBG9_9ACTN|nr:alpha/beta hydrolase [Actinoplanes aureus]MBG0563058.1 alpha/beta hydrolase [Actinoplanes aureus]
MSADVRPVNTAESFLLLHGWQNRRPPAHWQHWLAGELTRLGHPVDYPQLPHPDHPDLDTWLTELQTRVAALPGRRRTVLCHSLSCLLWLNAAARSAVPVPVDRVLLVAPPSREITLSLPEIAAFAVPETLTPDHLRAAAKHTRLIGTDNDPYCPAGPAPAYGDRLDIPTLVLPGAAHLNVDAGYGSWPSLLDWCLSPSHDHPITHRPAV